MATLVVKNGHPKDTCYYEDWTIHSKYSHHFKLRIFSQLGGLACMFTFRDKEFPIRTSYYFCISTSIYTPWYENLCDLQLLTG